MKKCGILLSGGNGTRLYPMTKVVSKQLLPVYDKPLIYYPLTTLKLAGVRDILIIVSSYKNKLLFEDLLGDGSDFGCTLSYKVQSKPRGLADAFIVGKEFISNRDVVLALGDNIFYGETFNQTLESICKKNRNIIFGCEVVNPERYGVALFNSNGDLKEIIEKPKQFVSNFAIPGLYFFDNTVIEKAEKLKPSPRGELEIVDIINLYLNDNNLKLVKLPYGTVWFDTGTPNSLFEAGEFIKVIQSRTGITVGDPSKQL